MVVAICVILANLSPLQAGTITEGTTDFSCKSTPLVFAVTQGEVIGIRDYIHFIDDHVFGINFEIQYLDKIGDYELLSYVPPNIHHLITIGADDIDGDDPPGGYVVYSNCDGIQHIAPLLSQFHQQEIPWDSLFVWTPVARFPTNADVVPMVFLDRDRMQLRERATPEPSSTIHVFLGVALVILMGDRRGRYQAYLFSQPVATIRQR
jgi:hypothetical protein